MPILLIRTLIDFFLSGVPLMFRFLTSILLLALAALPMKLQAQMPDPAEFRAGDYSELRDELAALAEEGRFWGAVLVAEGEVPVLRGAWGPADRAVGRLNSMDTAFNIASVGKQLTAAAVLRLSQSGRLDLDSSIGRWIEDLPGDRGETVTVRYLLQMASGWGDHMETPAYRDAPRAFDTVSDYVALIRTIEPSFEPGTDTVYSNASYELLGAVIEGVTGHSYQHALRQLVLDPAGMESSGCFEHRRAEGRAVPYARVYDRLIPAYPLMAQRCSPAGGHYSTTGDLLKFQRAVVDGEFLDEEHARLMTNRFRDDTPAGPMLAFIGGTEGANAWAETRLDSGITLVVLANLDPPAAERVALGLGKWLRARREAP